MADDPRQTNDARRALIDRLVAVIRAERGGAMKLWSPHEAGCDFGSEPTAADLTAAIAGAGRQDVVAHRRQMMLIVTVGVVLPTVMIMLIAVVYVCRDHVERLRVVFGGAALVLTHVAAATIGFLVGRSHRDAAEHD